MNTQRNIHCNPILPLLLSRLFFKKAKPSAVKAIVISDIDPMNHHHSPRKFNRQRLIPSLLLISDQQLFSCSCCAIVSVVAAFHPLDENFKSQPFNNVIYSLNVEWQRRDVEQHVMRIYLHLRRIKSI